ncbi:MAG: glycogen debranching enzyme family protein [Phycisphaerae bacterium]|nr:glycogen debranching enzyme family protein [Phycisphaerae bacterium]
MTTPPVYTRMNRGDPEALARSEWLLTDGQGGFAMGTALGAPMRRYHALLVASLDPPVRRVMVLGQVAESIVVNPGQPGEQRHDLSVFRFRPGVLHPRGDALLTRFEKDLSARWYFKAGELEVCKTVHLLQLGGGVAVRYDITGAPGPVRLVLRPLMGLRDFHGLNLRELARGRFGVEPGGRVKVSGPAASAWLWAESSDATGVRFAHEELWWHDFQYDAERDRGYDYLEDLFHPGAFEVDLPGGRQRVSATLMASVDPGAARDVEADRARRRQRLEAHEAFVRESFRNRGAVPQVPALVAAADDFVVRRTAPVATGSASAPDARATIIAGYPWFADWGRDSMISLPGLLLTTGRFAEARSVLLTFAHARRDGLVPNVFDDYTGQPHYNTVDASLWFIHAACRYLVRTGDRATFETELLPACRDVVAAYERGTRDGIGADPADGLIAAGSESTQLTWMDAKRDGVTFTPRHGKAVEINALWHHGLLSLAAALGPGGGAEADRWRQMAARVAASFRAKFWNASAACLYDTIAPGPGGAEAPQADVRPNQIFAASLRHSPLEEPMRRAVVQSVRSRLLTPLGVRTLDPADWRYKGRYRGRMFERDAAYHNGTAWPWLLGPLAEAVLRTGRYGPGACAEARAILAPALASLDGACPGQLPEVVDGDDLPNEPQRPGGCPAQAWSVAEVLRVSVLIARAEAGVDVSEL